MFNLRIKTKVTFSFSKLSKKLDTLLPQTERRNLRDVANQWKQNIEEGQAGGKKFQSLAESTKTRRKYKGYNPHYPRTKPQDRKTVLQATGNLLKSTFCFIFDVIIFIFPLSQDYFLLFLQVFHYLKDYCN